ncbi:MAG TPA: leucyl aminopeptidase [Gemmatimonadaceae bacterium]|nr:leucyl aminopeptidase [Gemmatimonadaceae bacterium]
MPLRITARRVALSALDTPLLVLALRKSPTLTPPLAELDRALGGALARTLERGDFRGRRDEMLHLAGGAQGPARVLLVGLGDPGDRPDALWRAAALAARHARRSRVSACAWWDDDGSAATAERIAAGISLGSWSYDDLRTPPPEDERLPLLDEAVIVRDDESAARDAIARGTALGQGIELARRLGMMPGNLCTPEFLADTARQIAERHGMRYTVLGRQEMQREGMGSLLAVAQGTPQDPKLIVLEHRRGPDGAKPIALVGKGLCFDSGGISIKPAQGMEWMKFDMCGAAGVLGAMETIGQLGLPVNVVGLVGSTTNMPSGTAMNPGDVVRSLSGKFIEIINTDAEGRLVLADVLAYARRFDPAVTIDAATLTGACVIALGHTATGVFGTDRALVDEVVTAGERAGEKGWPLPLWDEYKELIRSDIADVKNSGGRPAGSITAALFLKEFAGEYPWVHLDVAGTAYTESDLGFIPKGPTGVPVGTFVEFVRGRVS